MPRSIRIGTWNLDRSGVRKKERVPRQLEKMNQLNADVWVLTETHTSVSLPGYASVASDPDPTNHKEGESYSTILSRLPMREVPTQDGIFTVCGEIDISDVLLLVYGTIITYGADGVKERQAQPWERHRKAVQIQTSEWQQLTKQYPHHLLCIAGDFNMNLDGRRWYGISDAKTAVLKGLEAAQMYCATTTCFQDPPYSLSRSTVDHICFSSNVVADQGVEVWMDEQLSDHNGVLVEIRL